MKKRVLPRDLLGAIVEYLDITIDEFLPGFETIWERATGIAYQADPDEYSRLTQYRKHSIQEQSYRSLDWSSLTWYWKNKIHRDHDAPAIVNKHQRQWYQFGKRHRDNDKPAVESTDGSKAWYWRNQLHRGDDNPAVENANGDREWWVLGKLHRDGDKPAVEYTNGRKEWRCNGQLHRDD